MTAASPAVRSASTMRSSSSLGSRWVRRFPSSTLPGPTIPATTSTVWSAAAARSPASTSSPTPPSSATACRVRFSVAGPDAYTQTTCLTWDLSRWLLDHRSSLLGRRLRRQRLRRYAGSRHRRCAQGRPGLGYVPGSFVAHNNHAGYYGATRNPPVLPTTSGAGLFRAPCSSRTSRLVRVTRSTSAVYTDGATRYNLQSLAPQSFVMFGGTSAAGRLPERWCRCCG